MKTIFSIFKFKSVQKNSDRRKGFLYRLTVCFVAATFFATQVGFAADVTYLPTGTYQSTISVDEFVPEQDLTNFQMADGNAVMTDFLDDSPLSIVQDESNVLSSEESSHFQSFLSSITPNDPEYDEQWGVRAIHADDAWDFTMGEGVMVAVIDTGIIDYHPDIDDNIWTNLSELNGFDGVDDDGNGYIDDINGWDFVFDTNTPDDIQGHGTHVSGIIAAEGNNNEGIIGVAPESKILPVQVLLGPENMENPADREAVWTAVADGIRYAADLGAQVINISMGGLFSITENYLELAVHNAIIYARNAGSIVVVAAGNDEGDIAQAFPAAWSEVIAVGAIDALGDCIDESNYGEELDFVAPGKNIYSLEWPFGYGDRTGTSMASPMVAGIIALMLSTNPFLTFTDIYRRLRYSAEDLEPLGKDNYYGYGLVDAFKALSYDYFDTGQIYMHWLASPDEFDVVEYEYDLEGYDYDLAGRAVKKTFSDNSFVTIDYWSGTLDIKQKTYFLAGGIWEKTVDYYSDGTTIQKETYEDGTIKEYNEAGTLVRWTEPTGVVTEYYDSGNEKSWMEPGGTGYERLDEDFYENQTGRYSKQFNNDFTYIVFDEYFQDIDTVKQKSIYQSDDTLMVTYEYSLDPAVSPTGSDFTDTDATFFSSVQNTKSYEGAGGSASVVEVLGKVQLTYDTGTYGWTSSGWVYDDPGTPEQETIDLSGSSSFAFGLKGDASRVRLEVIDHAGQKAWVELEGIIPSEEKVFVVQASDLSGIDLTQVSEVRLTVQEGDQTGTLEINQTPSLRLEAEGLQTGGGTWNSGQAVLVWGAGKVFQTYDVTVPGVYEIEVRALGTEDQGQLPQLRAMVDNRIIGDTVGVTNNNWNYQDYIFQNVELEVGSHKFAAGILDGLGSQNISIDRIIIRRVGDLPPTSERVVLQAENMTTAGGAWNGGPYVMVWGSGKVYENYTLEESGIYDIEVVALGVEDQGELPQLRALVDNRMIGDTVGATINNWSYRSYLFEDVELEAGSHKFMAGILYGIQSQSISIDRVIIRKVGELPPPSELIVTQAEDMQTSGATWNGGPYIMVWADGEVTQDYNLTESGVYKVEVVALGDKTQAEWPRLHAKIGNHMIGDAVDVTVNNWSYKSYLFEDLELEAGPYQMTFGILDAVGGQSISFDQIIVRKVGELLPPEERIVNEAEVMETSGDTSVDSENGYVVFSGNGSISDLTDIALRGWYEIEILAMGQEGDGDLPLMRLTIDDQEIGVPVSVTHNESSFKSYFFEDVELEGGPHSFKVEFINDSGDRTLWVDKIIIRKVADFQAAILQTTFLSSLDLVYSDLIFDSFLFDFAEEIPISR